MTRVRDREKPKPGTESVTQFDLRALVHRKNVISRLSHALFAVVVMFLFLTLEVFPKKKLYFLPESE